MTGLTKRQKAIYEFIQQFIVQHGYSPSYREILRHFEFSSLGTVYKHLSILKRKGMVTNEPGCGRSIKPAVATDNGSAHASEVVVPFVGQLTATLGMEMFAEIHLLSLPAFMVVNPADTYVLRTRGDAWLDEQIADGDLLVIDTLREPSPNETVIARIHGQQIVIKRVFPEGQHFRLVGRTSSSAPLLLKADQVEIQGLVIGVIRLF